MAFGGRKPVNPLPHPESLMVPVKIPVVKVVAHPKGPKDAKGLNQMWINVGSPFVPPNVKKVRKVLESEFLREIHGNLRKKGARGIKESQLSMEVARICPRCHELGNPYVEYVEKTPKKADLVQHHWLNPDVEFQRERELVLFYTHTKSSKSELCRICRVIAGRYIRLEQFPNSDIDLRDLQIGPVIRHIIHNEKGYGKFSKIFHVQTN